jgi:hypothetical protein
MNVNQIKEIIRRELPLIMQQDIEMQDFVIRLARPQFADKKETESRFDRLMDELRRDREAHEKRWEEQERKWEEQNKKWWENQESIKKLFDKYDSGIGSLVSRWGLHAEEAFRNGLKGILGGFFRCGGSEYYGI